MVGGSRGPRRVRRTFVVADVERDPLELEQGAPVTLWASSCRLRRREF